VSNRSIWASNQAIRSLFRKVTEMKATLKLIAVIWGMCSVAIAQVAPAATGVGGLPIDGNLHYSVRYSQTALFSALFPNAQSSTASGSVNYANRSRRFPFSLDYGGGYTWAITGASFQTGQFHHMYLSQGGDWKNWKFVATDNVSYLPASPTTGFTGIPGIGEPIGVTNPAPTSGQSILTQNTHIIDNGVNAELRHTLSNATAIGVGASFELLRFPNNDGLDTDAKMANAEIISRVNGRSSFTGDYRFLEYSYPGFAVTFEANTGLVGYRRRWTRNATTNVAAGPQWVSSSDSTIVPSSINIAANATFLYQMRFSSASLSYNRGTNGGAGYLFGGEIDSVSGNLSRQFGLNLTVGLTGGYDRTSGLNNNGVTNGKYGAAQATWRLGRTLILFANYTGTDQGSSSRLPSNALNQLQQIIGFGVGYSPRETRLRQ
jgi:hypothetical protein